MHFLFPGVAKREAKEARFCRFPSPFLSARRISFAYLVLDERTTVVKPDGVETREDSCAALPFYSRVCRSTNPQGDGRKRPTIPFEISPDEGW